MMGERLLGFFYGFAVAGIFVPILLMLFNKDIIAECEAELPRNQHCKFMAVPMDAE